MPEPISPELWIRMKVYNSAEYALALLQSDCKRWEAVRAWWLLTAGLNLVCVIGILVWQGWRWNLLLHGLLFVLAVMGILYCTRQLLHLVNVAEGIVNSLEVATKPQPDQGTRMGLNPSTRNENTTYAKQGTEQDQSHPRTVDKDDQGSTM